METSGTGLAHWTLLRGEGPGGQESTLVRTRLGDTLTFLRLQVSLEERLAQHGIAIATASARKGIFGGQHDEDLLDPTFMDDLAVLVEGNTSETMLDKLSTALQVVKEVCEENALTLNMSAGKTEAIVLIQNDKPKEAKRRLYVEVEDCAATLETPAGPFRVVDNYHHLGCRVDCTRNPEHGISGQTLYGSGSHSGLGAFTFRRPGSPDEGQDECGEVDRPQQASPPGWPVDEFEQSPAGTAAREVHGAFAACPWPAQAARAADPQPAVDKLRLAIQRETSPAPTLAVHLHLTVYRTTIHIIVFMVAELCVGGSC